MFIFESEDGMLQYDMDNYHSTWREKSFGKWDSYTLCKLEASKYSNRTSFSYGSRDAYNSSVAHYWIDDFFPKKQHIWTPKTLGVELEKFDYNLDRLKSSNRDAYTAYRKLIAKYDKDDMDPYVEEIIKQLKLNNQL